MADFHGVPLARPMCIEQVSDQPAVTLSIGRQQIGGWSKQVLVRIGDVGNSIEEEG